jgi:hypothetical protein
MLTSFQPASFNDWESNLEVVPVIRTAVRTSGSQQVFASLVGLETYLWELLAPQCHTVPRIFMTFAYSLWNPAELWHMALRISCFVNLCWVSYGQLEEGQQHAEDDDEAYLPGPAWHYFL